MSDFTEPRILNGLKIIPNSLAYQVKVEWRLERHPTQKRRRNWRAKEYRTKTPCCFVSGGVCYMHPDLFAKLKEQP